MMDDLAVLFLQRSTLLTDLNKAKEHRETFMRQVAQKDNEISTLDQKIFILERKISELAKKIP